MSLEEHSISRIDKKKTKRKKRNNTRRHTRTNRNIPFFLADALFKECMPGKMQTSNISAYFTVAAEEVLISLLEDAAKHVKSKGFNKKGQRKGRLKAEHVAKALANPGASFYQVLPTRVAGEFVKDPSFQKLLRMSHDEGGPPKKRTKKNTPEKEEEEPMDIDKEEKEEEEEEEMEDDDEDNYADDDE